MLKCANNMWICTALINKEQISINKLLFVILWNYFLFFNACTLTAKMSFSQKSENWNNTIYNWSCYSSMDSTFPIFKQTPLIPLKFLTKGNNRRVWWDSNSKAWQTWSTYGGEKDINTPCRPFTFTISGVVFSGYLVWQKFTVFMWWSCYRKLNQNV